MSSCFSYGFVAIMPNELNIEQQIREAMERGEFDNLSGKGKPLDLDAYFATPEDIRMGYAMLKSNEFIPDEVEKFNESAKLKEAIRNSTDDIERAALRKKLNELSLAITMRLELRKRRR